jgi:hypothetical protein
MIYFILVKKLMNKMLSNHLNLKRLISFENTVFRFDFKAPE